jgi:hypothetical protein
MVWSQYVYEASANTEVIASSDDDDPYEESLLNIESFQDLHSDELYHLFDIIQQLLYDAFLNHTYHPQFSDFIQFCFEEEREDRDLEPDSMHASEIKYIWDKVQQHDTRGITKHRTFTEFLDMVTEK